MFLSGKDIEQLVKNKEIIIEPFDAGYLKGASYTLTLGSKYRILKAKEFIDSREDPEFEEYTIGNDGFELKPGSFAIFYTKEKVSLNNKFTCILSTRPTIAQMGLNVTQSSFFCEPNTDNQLALEISNNGSMTVRLHVGTKIVCGVFGKLKKI